MSSEFRFFPLEELCLKITDGAHQSPKSVVDGKPMYSVKDMTQFGFSDKSPKLISVEDYEKLASQGCRPEIDDILIAKDGSVMKHVFKVSEPLDCALLSSIAILRPNKEKVEPDYLVHSLLNPEVKNDVLHNYVSGSGVPRIVLKDFKKIVIKLPSIQAQRSIANTLSSLNEKIKVNQQTNQTLEHIAQAIFKSWFVDFEPVKAKINALEAGGSKEDALLAAMQAISGKDKAQIAQLQTENPERYNELRTTAELFPSAMQDSELGEIPEGWSSSDIGKEVTVVGGATPSTKNPEFWDGGGIAWTSPRDLSSLTDKILIDTERKITKAGLAKISSGLLPVNTVLMSSRAPVGYLALTKLPVAVNQGYIAMKCEKVLSPEFTLQWCSAHMDEIKNRASGTTFAEISKKNFKVIPVIVPTEEVVDAFSKQARSLYSLIESNVRESDSLGLIRDALLPKILSGEIEIAATN